MLLSYSTTRCKYWIYRSIFQAKLIKSIFMCIQIIKPYIYQTHIYQSVESLRPSSISKLDNMHKATQCSIQSVLNSPQNVGLPVHATTCPICSKSSFLHFSQFLPPYFTLHLFKKPLLQFPPTLSPSLTQHFWASFFYVLSSLNFPPKAISIPQPFSQFRLNQETNEKGRLEILTVLICSCFSKA